MRCHPFLTHIQQGSHSLVRTWENAADSRIIVSQSSSHSVAQKDFAVDYLLLGLFHFFLIVTSHHHFFLSASKQFMEFNHSIFKIDHYRGAVMIGRKWKVKTFRNQSSNLCLLVSYCRDMEMWCWTAQK